MIINNQCFPHSLFTLHTWCCSLYNYTYFLAHLNSTAAVLLYYSCSIVLLALSIFSAVISTPLSSVLEQ